MTPETPEAPEFVHGIRKHMIYKASPRDLVTAGARKVNPEYPYDQAYGQFIRVTVTGDPTNSRVGETWMIDTYHISGLTWPVGTTKSSPIECLMRMETVTPYGLGTMISSCYYNDCVKLTETNATKFEPFCDLREFEIHKQNDIAHYADEDVRLGVHLYREHGYTFSCGDVGVNMLRRDAKPEPTRKLARLADKAITQCRKSACAESDVRAFERYAMSHLDTPHVYDLLDHVRKEYETYRQTQDLRESARMYADPGQMTIPGITDDDEGDKS